MNDAQQVFTVFYGLYFAASLGLSRPMQPFDTASMYSGNYHAWLRFFGSFTLLNILPLLYFVFVFGWLNAISRFEAHFTTLLMLLLVSLGGFGFYRLFVGIMLSKLKGEYLFYGDKLPAPFKAHLDERLVPADSPRHHIVPGLIWILGCFLIACLWTHSWQ